MQEVSMDGNVGRRLRIAQVLVAGSQWGEITPDTIEKGLGGRETAVLQLGRQWAERGHHVECFVPLSTPPAPLITPAGGRLEFLDIRAARVVIGSAPRDVVVSWELPEIFDDPRVAANANVKMIGMQVAHLALDEHQAQTIDKIVCLSPWARDFLSGEIGFVGDDDFWGVVPNGVDLSRYPFPPLDIRGVRRKSSVYFYSSSPDRGLHHLLRMWKRVRSEIDSHAMLHVGYGAMRWVEQQKWSHNLSSEIALLIERGLKQPGVIDRGLMGQSELARLQMISSMLPYTCDTMQPTETGCITVTEAMAAGAPVITTNCDCLPSEYGSAARIVNLPFDDNAFLAEMDLLYRNTELYIAAQEAGRQLAEGRSWELTSAMWLEEMQSALRKKEVSLSSSGI